METYGLRIEPLDVLFFRDGRPFGAATRVRSGLPMPQTLAGAIRTALLSRTGFDFQAFATSRRRCEKTGVDSQEALKQALRDGHADEKIITSKFRGPWLAVFPNEEPVPLFAQPLDILKAKESSKFVPLRPSRNELPGWNDSDQLLPLLRQEATDGKAPLKLFTLPALIAYSNGKLDFAETELFDSGDVYSLETRTGIGIHPESLTSADGMIYGIEFLALKTKIAEDKNKAGDKCKHGRYAGARTGFYAEIACDLPRPELERLLTAPIPWGGESRYARVTLANQSITWPTASANTRAKWLLVSPAFLPFSEKSHRPLPKFDNLKAAVSGAGIAVSGWDVAKRGPRATRFAIPAGAVYYFEGPGPTDGFLGESDDEKAEGWGFALPGTWEEKNA